MSGKATRSADDVPRELERAGELCLAFAKGNGGMDGGMQLLPTGNGGMDGGSFYSERWGRLGSRSPAT